MLLRLALNSLYSGSASWVLTNYRHTPPHPDTYNTSLYLSHNRRISWFLGSFSDFHGPGTCTSIQYSGQFCWCPTLGNSSVQNRGCQPCVTQTMGMSIDNMCFKLALLSLLYIEVMKRLRFSKSARVALCLRRSFGQGSEILWVGTVCISAVRNPAR